MEHYELIVSFGEDVAELYDDDLMARIAGLRPKECWDGRQREPFTSTHNRVSVYGR